MLRLLFSGFSLLIVLGFFLALMLVFDWDVEALLTWAWNWAVTAVETIASWFMNADWFQKAVTS